MSQFSYFIHAEKVGSFIRRPAIDTPLMFALCVTKTRQIFIFQKQAGVPRHQTCFPSLISVVHNPKRTACPP